MGNVRALPRWTWFFVALCGVIPVISLGSAIPVALGGVGAYSCARVAGKPLEKERSSAWGQCFVITLCCWIGFVAFVALLATVRVG